jgi:hypothetical protein
LIRLGIAGYAFVAFEDGAVEARWVDSEPLLRGQQLPCVGDGFLLEVVAKAEVAEHFEEGVVAACEADVFEVVVFSACADAFLRACRARVVAFFRAQEDVFELIHSCVGE